MKSSLIRRIKSTAWPIQSDEVAKFLTLSLMMACVVFVCSMTRDIRQTLMISEASGGGVETLGFLRICGATPAMLLLLPLFMKLSNKLSRDRLFCTVVLCFSVFFLLFGFVLFPYRNTIHISSCSIEKLQTIFPNLYWFWPVVGNWSFSLFFIMSDAWKNFVLSILFWRIANEAVSLEESKRFYGFFALLANVGLVFSGVISAYCSSETLGETLEYQMLVVALCGILLVLLYKFMAKNGHCSSNDTYLYQPKSFMLSLKHVFKIKYFVMIFILIVSCNICMDLIEYIWGSKIHQICENSVEFYTIMGKLSIFTGLSTMAIVFAAASILRNCSWRSSALVLPVSFAFFCLIFVVIMKYGDEDFIIFSGIAYICLTKGIKYALFDSTNQMAYIPLRDELRINGQAAVETFASRGGKASSSAVQMLPLMIYGGDVAVSGIMGFFSLVIYFFLSLWVIAVFSISKDFERLKTESWL